MNTESFLQTLRNDILDASEYADAARLNEELLKFVPLIERLEAKNEDAAALFASPLGRRLASLLLGVKETELKDLSNRRALAPLLQQWRSWLQGQPVHAVILGLLLAEAHSTRKNRRRRKFESIVASAMREAVLKVGRGFHLVSNWTLKGYRTFDLAVVQRSTPLVAVIDVFQIGSGGRQSDVIRDMPGVQDVLAKQSIALLVIADGPGFAAVPSLVRRVLPELRFVTNLTGLEKGELSALLEEALRERETLAAANAKTRDERFFAITKEALSRGRIVTPDVLGTNASEAEAYLLRFRATNPSYALVAADGGYTPEAATDLAELRQSFAVARARREFDAAQLVRSLAERLGLSAGHSTLLETGTVHYLAGLNLPLRLPSPLPLFAPKQPDALNQECFEDLEHSLAGADVPGRVIVILDPYQPQESRRVARHLGLSRRLQFAVLDETDLVEILLRDRPGARDEFRRFLLRRADLSVVSPFIAEGPTSRTMFFGRDAELRRIAEQVREHSFALVGGRKVGKTSLLQQLAETLAGVHKVVYIDCQAHPDREDFLAYILANAIRKETVSGGLLAPHSERLLSTYLDAQFGSSFGVMLVDEVDDLFLADAQANAYPHVLSRAFRSLSQSGRMSLIATGERGLFTLTRDPSSPHWNFCTPLRIGPLEQEAAERLLSVPFRALGVQAVPEALSTALAFTVRHPNLLQHLGSEVVEMLAPASRNGEPLKIAAEQITAICTQPDFRDRFVRTFWSQATTLERLLSAELRHDSTRSPEELLQLLGAARQVVRMSEVLEGLSYLELYGIARSMPGGFAFTAAIFEQYLRLIPKSLLEQWQSELVGNVV
jgi:hypothetical protein